MVARLTQILTWEDVWRFSQPLTADAPKDNLQPRYNVAPTQDVMIVRLGWSGRREAARVCWGLIPGWAKDAAGASKCINARSETVDRLPSFRDAFARRRCLVLASGFYEWRKQDKQPFYITSADGTPLAFAGLWESWPPRRGPAIETCTIITGTPNELLAPIHNRMPVILDEVDAPRWLGEDLANLDELKSLLCPCPADRLRMWPVGREVGKVSADDPELIGRLSV